MAEASDWADSLGTPLVVLELWAELEEDVVLDYSLSSLEELGFFHAATDMAAVGPEDKERFAGYVAYVGESLLRLTGGHWEFDDRPGFAERASGWPEGFPVGLAADYVWQLGVDGPTMQGLPIVVADERLGLEPVSVLPLVARATEISADLSAEFREVFGRWERAAADYRAAHPEWETPGFGRPPVETSPAMDAWIAEQEKAFPAWVQQYGGGTTWDFSPETIDAVGRVVLEVIGTRAALYDRDNAGFVDPACWYVSEMFIRHNPTSRWEYWPERTDAGDPEINAYKITNAVEHYVSGFGMVRSIIRTSKTAVFRGRYDEW